MKQIDALVVKPFHWLAKHSYGIYLWHLVLVNNLMANCGWPQRLSYPVLSLVFMVLSCTVGYVSSQAGRALRQVTPFRKIP